MHGGKSLQGIAHPSWKHGRSSKLFKTGLFRGVVTGDVARHYETARANDALLDLRDHIALQDAEIFGLLEQLSAGCSVAAWRRVDELITGIHSDLKACGDGADCLAATKAKMIPLLAEAENLTRAGAQLDGTWRTVERALLVRRKLTATEIQRQRVAAGSMDHESVLGLVALIAAAIGRHVTDPVAKQRIADDMRALIGGRPN
jgi:hypothetical protein